jgi:polyhydroxyalkanoate synthesis regulator phasin
MFDLVKQSVYLGLGVASLTRDKLMDVGKEIATRAQLSKEEAKQFEEDLAHKAEQARHDLQAMIDRQIDHALIQFGILRSKVMSAGEQATEDISARVDSGLDQTLNRLRVARTEDVEALVSRVELLEKKVAELQK